MLEELKKELQELADKKQAEILQKFFKTGKGEYGEGDVFLGIRVWGLRNCAKKYQDLSLEQIQELLNSEIHEHRFIGLIILTKKYEKKPQETFEFYIRNSKRISAIGRKAGRFGLSSRTFIIVDDEVVVITK